MSFLIKKEKKTQMFPPILQYYFIIKQIGATNIITSLCEVYGVAATCIWVMIHKMIKCKQLKREHDETLLNINVQQIWF